MYWKIFSSKVNLRVYPFIVSVTSIFGVSKNEALIICITLSVILLLEYVSDNNDGISCRIQRISEIVSFPVPVIITVADYSFVVTIEPIGSFYF